MGVGGDGSETYIFNGQTVRSHDDIVDMVDNYYYGFERIPGYPLSVNDMFEDSDLYSGDGYSGSELRLFLNAYTPES